MTEATTSNTPALPPLPDHLSVNGLIDLNLVVLL